MSQQQRESQTIDLRSRRPNTPGGGSSRIPPHNLQAEESLLGAMLLSRDAIGPAVEICHAQDFYKPAHGHIFEAIISLWSRGEPADPVTVADELSRADLLEAIGGPATLLSLQMNTPATSNAGRYARIVEEHALLRRLIQVAGDIAEMGYSVPEDVVSTVDQAESMMFEIAQRRVADTMAPIRDLLSQSLDRLEALYDRGESITGVPTGFADLDERLSGLQPNALLIIGARPAMGKALALDTPIATPEGWKTMGDLVVGDRVFDEQGSETRVTYKSPVYENRSCYELTFDDGSKIVADAEHLWSLYDYKSWRGLRERGVGQPVLRTTQQIFDEGIKAPVGDSRPNWYVPLSAPIELPEVDLPVDPYDLGCSLGAENGYIPAAYLRASIKQRLALLQGLMDTDGCVTNANGTVELCLANRRLLEQARELACSLGHKVPQMRVKSITLPDGRVAEAWRIRWTPLDPVFRMERKASRLELTKSMRRFGKHTRRAIVSVTPVDSVPVQCMQVDSPNHLYLAGDSMIPTHNTSFALNMVSNAAASGAPVLFFSLEMSHLEITQRLLCAEARVDASRLRNGNLHDTDWPKINHAIGKLGEAPIFIDDNPMCTVMDVRAKARRLKATPGGLGLVVIDYLQLMSGRSGAESRQVEVSEMSRGLKILARELQVPVIALSQLSRSLEMRADKRPILADLRESGCLTADTRIRRADSGAETTIGALYQSGERNVPVYTLDDQWKMSTSVMTHAFSSGVKEVFELRLASGRTVKATANHPFRTIAGWVSLGNLSVGSRIAVPRVLPMPDELEVWPEEEVILLAHLLGDGCVLARQPVHYTSNDPANLNEVERVAAHWGVTPVRVQQKDWWHVYLPSPFRLSRGKRNPIVQWWSDLGLYDCRSYDKFIPDPVFSLSDSQIALFVRHLWSTDGHLAFRRQTGRKEKTVSAYYATSSRRLADGVQALLLRLGISSRIYTARKAGYRDSFHVRIHGAENLLSFVGRVGAHGRRGEAAAEMLEYLRSVTTNPNVDTIPFGVREKIVASMQDRGVTQRQLAAAINEDYCGSYLLGSEKRPRESSRKRLGVIAQVLEDKELLALAESDVFWDKIVGIESLGQEEVFDATVLGTHNFLANDLIVHNSLEQDADVVMFLYRDEVYNQESPDKGTAEVIVAKHRNGPVGTTQLAFIDRYTRFANMARV